MTAKYLHIVALILNMMCKKYKFNVHSLHTSEYSHTKQRLNHDVYIIHSLQQLRVP